MKEGLVDVVNAEQLRKRDVVVVVVVAVYGNCSRKKAVQIELQQGELSGKMPILAS